MFKKAWAILYIPLMMMSTGCAWENLPEGGEQKRLVIQVTMIVGGAMKPELFYYIVFNVSGDPEKKPHSVFDGENRGKNWDIYYMWGTPPLRELDLYRGLGTVGASRANRLDEPPLEEAFLNELESGTVVEGDRMTLRIDFTELGVTSDYINLNMIVCNQAIDRESRLEYEYDPYVYDSFLDRGITINLSSTSEDFWDEAHFPQEDLPNEHEDVAWPEADIVSWRFHVVSR